jgi:hypothetical protein
MDENSYLKSYLDDSCTGKEGQEGMLGECQVKDKSEAQEPLDDRSCWIGCISSHQDE